MSRVALEKIDEFRWRIPKSYKQGMRVPGIIYADEKLLKDIHQDKALEQVANVAFLPGIVRASFAMPDIHWGFGFSIGGVAATDTEDGGVISPGGVGYDINCGVRLIRRILPHDDVKDKIKRLSLCFICRCACWRWLKRGYPHKPKRRERNPAKRIEMGGCAWLWCGR